MKAGTEALLVTQKVLELEPNNPTAHINLGSIYKDLGNLDQALAFTLKSLELNLTTQTPSSAWAASTKISATLINLPSLSNLGTQSDNPDAPSTWAASTKISATRSSSCPHSNP